MTKPCPTCGDTRWLFSCRHGLCGSRDLERIRYEATRAMTEPDLDQYPYDQDPSVPVRWWHLVLVVLIVGTICVLLFWASDRKVYKNAGKHLKFLARPSVSSGVIQK